tara:strand:+ start:152 stop:493 length:342 start_codon:yes stop_codon:yes gene_type:complete
MTRKNPEKLSVEYPVIKSIKRKMKRNPDIKEHQICDFDRRVKASPFLLEIIKFAQNLQGHKTVDKEEKKEEERLGDIIRGHLYTIEDKDKIIENLNKKIQNLESQLEVYRAFD